MSDGQMDQRLREAGARWREVTPSMPAMGAPVDLGPITAPPRRRRPRTWIAAAASVAAIAAAVALGIALAGRGDKTPAAAGNGAGLLVGTTWRISGSTFTGGPSAGPDLPPQRVEAATLTISADGTVSGSDGCNSFSGTVAIRGTHLIFGSLARTERACVDTQGSITEAAVDGVLRGEVTWAIKGNRLTVTGPHGELDYLPAAPNDPEDLYGTTWGLQSVEHDNGNSGSGSASTDTSRVTLRIAPDGRFAVGGECGSFSGRIRVGVHVLTPYGVAIGERTASCADLSEVERMFGLSAEWSIQNKTLTLRHGATTLTFVPVGGGVPSEPTVGPSISGSSQPPVRDASALPGTSWQLADIRQTVVGRQLAGGGGPASSVAAIGLTFDKSGGFVVKDQCGAQAGTVSVGSGTATFSGLHTTVDHSCPPDPVFAEDNRVLQQMLTGQAQWAIVNGQLSLTKGGTTLLFAPA